MSGYATVKEALGWLESDVGSKDRRTLLEYLNDARRLFYTVHQRLRLDFYSEACFCVDDFCQHCFSCGDNTEGTFVGISLPNEMEQVEAAWVNSRPIPLYDKWMEYKHGLKLSEGSQLRFIDVGGDYPLERDWGCNRCVKLKFIAIDPDDCGKQVTVKYTAPGGTEKLEHIGLTLEGNCVESHVEKLARPGGIVLPPGLVGGVLVQDAESGKLLARLHPRISVPSFRRLKLTGTCCGNQVYVRATRKYTELYFDWEVVETDNKLAILDAHRYLRIMSNNSSDPTWLQKAAAHMSNVEGYLSGANSRSDGASTIRNINLLPQEKRRSGLRSRRYISPWGLSPK